MPSLPMAPGRTGIGGPRGAWNEEGEGWREKRRGGGPGRWLAGPRESLGEDDGLRLTESNTGFVHLWGPLPRRLQRINVNFSQNCSKSTRHNRLNHCDIINRIIVIAKTIPFYLLNTMNSVKRPAFQSSSMKTNLVKIDQNQCEHRIDPIITVVENITLYILNPMNFFCLSLHVISIISMIFRFSPHQNS